MYFEIMSRLHKECTSVPWLNHFQRLSLAVERSARQLEKYVIDTLALIYIRYLKDGFTLKP
jgi:hypothetical protein